MPALNTCKHFILQPTRGRRAKVPRVPNAACQCSVRLQAERTGCQVRGGLRYTRRTTDARAGDSHSPALPGGHAKWVQIPRGAATVSGELHPQPDSAGSHCDRTLSSWEGSGCTSSDPQARIPDAGLVLFRLVEASARYTPRRSSVRSRSVFHVLTSVFPFSLSAAAAVYAGPVTGRIVDPEGRAVAGAQVLLVGDGGAVRSTVSSASGEFTLAVPDAGRFELRVALDGFRAEPASSSRATAAPRDLGVRCRCRSARSPNRSSCPLRRSRSRCRACPRRSPSSRAPSCRRGR